MAGEQCWLAIETGGTKVIARISNATGEVAQARWSTPAPDKLLELLVGFARGHRLTSVGIASFGPVIVDPKSPRYGELLATPKPGWSGANLRGDLEKRLGVPVAVDTDVNAAAHAEAVMGAGRGADSLAYVTIGTGIGAGLFRNGRTLTGALHPEMGHVPVVRLRTDVQSSLCRFHAHCVEGLAAGPAVRERTGGGPLVAGSGAFDIVADYLGQFFATLVLAWSPNRIVAGGGVMQTSGLRRQAAARMVAALGGYGVGDQVVAQDFIVAPQLDDAGLEGALLMAQALSQAE